MSSHRLLLGHRGARAVKSIPENTLASFDRALADGCDGFEFDVRLTADGEAVVCHDPKIGRVEIASAAGKDVKALPRLQDILHRYQQTAFLDIELKVSGLEKAILGWLEKYPPRVGFVVSSFLPEPLCTVHAANPTIPLGLICETSTQLARWQELPVEYVIPHQRLVTQRRLREFRAENKKVLVWTVNRREVMMRLAAWGVDGIISDDTRLLAKTLEK